jgi:hypothetical protein
MDDGRPIKLLSTRGSYSLSMTMEFDDPYLLDRLAEHTLPAEGEIVGGPLDGLPVQLEQSRSRSD